MLLRELLSPSDFWDDRRHLVEPNIAEYFDKNFIGQTFPTEDRARRAIIAALTRDKPDLLTGDHRNEIRIAMAAPIYFDGSTYRIGTEKKQPKLTWAEIRIKPESKREIAISAEAQFEDCEIHWQVQHFDLASILPERAQDSYMRDRKEAEYIEALAKKIIENRWVTPLFIGQQEDEDGRIERWVVEGQHRARALLYHLGLQTAPGYLFESLD